MRLAESPPPPFPANFSSSSCYNLPKGGGAYPGRDLSRCSSAGQLSHDRAVSAGGGPVVRRKHVGRAGRRRGAGRGGSLPHPAGPCPAVAGVSRVSAGLRGRHRPAWLWVSGRAVFSAASGMVRSPSFCADGSRASARRTGQQFQHLPSPLAGAAAGLRRGRVSGCAGYPAVSGPERRADVSRHSANWQRIPPCSGPSATPVSRCRNRFQAGRSYSYALPPCRTPCPARCTPTYPLTSRPLPPCRRPNSACGSSPAPRCPGTAFFPPSRLYWLRLRLSRSMQPSVTFRPLRAAGSCCSRLPLCPMLRSDEPLNLSVGLAPASFPDRGALGRPGQPCCSLGLKLGARQRALFSLEATAGLRSTKECWASSRELRQRSPAVSGSRKLCSSSTTITDSPVAPLPGELASRRRD